MASFEMYLWFSEVMNRVHGFLGYLEQRVKYSRGVREELGQIPSQNLVVLGIETNVIFFNVHKEFVCSQNLGDLDQLVIIVVTMEKGFFSEDLGNDS